MGIASWFARRNGISPSPLDPEVRSMYGPGSFIAGTLDFSTSATNIAATRAFNLSAVYRAVAVVSGAVGQLPLRTIEQTPDGISVRARSFLDDVGGERFTPVEWAEVVTTHMLLHGNAFLQHIRNGSGQLVALYPVHPLSVTVEWDSSRPGGKLFKVTVEGGAIQKFDAKTMTQIMMSPTLDDGLTGVSVLSSARMSLSGALAGDRAANRLMTSGSSIGGIVTPEEEDLDETEAQAAQEAIQQNMLGPENAGQIVVMNKRMKFAPWTMTAQDAQFIESRKFSIDEVCRWFGVQPHQLAETEKSTSWGQGIDKLNQGFARETLRPITGRIEQRLTRLISDPRRKAEFEYAAFVEPAPEVKIQLILNQVGGGLITPNEGRRFINMLPLPGGEKLLTPIGGTPPREDDDTEESDEAPPQEVQ